MLHPFTTRRDNPRPPTDAEVYGETFGSSGVDVMALALDVIEADRAERECAAAAEQLDADAFPPTVWTDAELEEMHAAHLAAEAAREAADTLTAQLIERTCTWGLRWDDAYGKAG